MHMTVAGSVGSRHTARQESVLLARRGKSPTGMNLVARGFHIDNRSLARLANGIALLGGLEHLGGFFSCSLGTRFAA